MWRGNPVKVARRLPGATEGDVDENVELPLPVVVAVEADFLRLSLKSFELPRGRKKLFNDGTHS